MTRLPTLAPVLSAAGQTARRFPVVLIAALACAVAAICMVDEIGPAWMQGRLLAAASLGLPLFTAATLAAERDEGLLPRILWYAGSVIVLAGVFAVWPGLTEQQRFLRYAQLSVAGHLAVAFLPVPRGLHNAFWQFNRTLFLRFVVSAVTTGVTWAGLALALVALDKLFGVDVPDEGYARLWFVLAFVVTTWRFLGGVPRDHVALEARRDYPAGLRVFAQYTLLPLVSLYLVILTLYLGKVLVTWDWPSGWIGWLVSGVATAGIFTLLLVHPAAAEQKWVGVFARDFWIAILPAIGMLWLAIKQRTDQYGVTEPRYFLLVMSVWLFGLALFYIVTRSPHIRVIPASLCLVALVTFTGPLSAYAMAERSQFGRLRAILERTGVVAGATRKPGPHTVPADEHREIKGTLRFLVERNATGRLTQWLPGSADSLARLGGEAEVRGFMEALGVAYGRPGERVQDFAIHRTENHVIGIAGFDSLVSIEQRNDSVRALPRLAAMLSESGRALEVTRGGAVLITIPLDSLLALARPPVHGGRFGLDRNTGRLVQSQLVQRAENARLRAMVALTSVSGQIRSDGAHATRIEGSVTLSLRR